MSVKRSQIALLLCWLVMLGVCVAPSAASASPTSRTKIGGWSQGGNWTAFDAAVGRLDIYRGYDTGFHHATWAQVPAGQRHGTMTDYSFKIPPAQLAVGQWDARLRTFIASTPRNVVLTNYHEPENDIEAGAFSAVQYRQAIARLNRLVDAQNAADRGTRRVSVILMGATFTGLKGRNPANYWPTAADGGSADLISADVYNSPNGTGTAVPLGYTTGAKWKTAAQLLQPVLRFAAQHRTDWAVSEFGVLEDVHDAARRPQLLRDAVILARAGRIGTTAWRPALWIQYWSARGPRGDWSLGYQHPVPSASSSSPAFRTWRDLARLP
jgi:hypothetical protein